MTSQFYPGTGYIYKFPTPISHNGWQIVGVYVDPFLFRPATVVHAYVIAPEAEVIALSSAGPALPRKKGELKWQTGKVSLFQYDVPRLMGVPLDIGYRSARTTTLATYDRQIAEITLWDNGISKISCYNAPAASNFYGQ